MRISEKRLEQIKRESFMQGAFAATIAAAYKQIGRLT